MLAKIILDNTIGTKKTFKAINLSSNSTGLSDVLDLGGYSINSINMSTAWTNANLSFLVSADSTDTMRTLRHTTAGVELLYVTTASRCLAVDPYLFGGIRYIQLRSGTQASPVAQATTRSIILGLAPVNPIS